jgi:GNAT superfamily N-acetyltransferase
MEQEDGQVENLILREAKAGDYPEINALATEYQREHAKALPGIFAETRDVLTRPWFRSFLGAADKTVRVAEIDGAAAAFALIEMKDAMPYPAFVPRRYAVIYEFGVSSHFQRRGIGTRLFADCRQWALSHGAESIELTMFEFNARALAFYESLGMGTLSRTLRMGLEAGGQADS